MKVYNNLRIVAMITLAILLFSVAGEWITVYLTNYQLSSPIIPASTLAQINGPFKLMAIILSSVALLALILFFCKKHLFVVILCGGTIVFLELYSLFS